MKTMNVDKALELCRKYLGCGDNSCQFVKPKGMATNGGCRCQDRPLVMASLAALYKAVEATKVEEKESK